MSELSDFIEARLGTAEPAEPVGVTNDRERQEALKAKGESIQQWRKYISGQAPAEKVDGAQLSTLVAALGGVGFVSEVCGLRPYDIEQAIRHSSTTMLSDNAVRKFVTAAQNALREQHRNG